MVAIVVAWLLARRNAVSKNIDGSHIDLLIPITIIVGVAGGVLLSLAMPMDQLIAGEMMQAGIRVRLFGLLATGAVCLAMGPEIPTGRPPAGRQDSQRTPLDWRIVAAP